MEYHELKELENKKYKAVHFIAETSENIDCNHWTLEQYYKETRPDNTVIKSMYYEE